MRQTGHAHKMQKPMPQLARLAPVRYLSIPTDAMAAFLLSVLILFWELDHEFYRRCEQ